MWDFGSKRSFTMARARRLVMSRLFLRNNPCNCEHCRIVRTDEQERRPGAHPYTGRVWGGLFFATPSENPATHRRAGHRVQKRLNLPTPASKCLRACRVRHLCIQFRYGCCCILLRGSLATAYGGATSVKIHILAFSCWGS